MRMPACGYRPPRTRRSGTTNSPSDAGGGPEGVRGEGELRPPLQATSYKLQATSYYRVQVYKLQVTGKGELRPLPQLPPDSQGVALPPIGTRSPTNEAQARSATSYKVTSVTSVTSYKS